MKLYKIYYTLFEIYTRHTYVYSMDKESAITMFKMSAANLGLMDEDYEVDVMFELNHIEKEFDSDEYSNLL